MALLSLPSPSSPKLPFFLVLLLSALLAAALPTQACAAADAPAPAAWPDETPPAGPEPESQLRPLPPELLVDELAWREIAPGLESLELQLGRQKPKGDSASRLSVSPVPAGHKGNLAILRSDPAKCAYSLHMASENGSRRSLRACAREYGLDAAINAGMFLPDNLKNTGYMRNASHVNNPRIVANFGVFFLAEPLAKNLPRAVLAEKNEFGDKLAEKIADYTIAVQNYRLTNGRGEILWPESLEAYSISALGRDKQGRILFVCAEYQLSAPDFARVLLLLPLEVDLLMYLEGGSQAGLVILEPAEPGANGEPAWRVWRGRHGLFSGLGGPDEVLLPNILGVRSLERP